MFHAFRGEASVGEAFERSQLDIGQSVERHCADNKRRIGITGDDLAVTSAAHIKSRHYPFCRVNTDASVIWFEL